MVYISLHIHKMITNPTTYAYISWRDCLKKQENLRKELALPADKKEDEDMCRYAYRIYFKSTLKHMKTKCGKLCLDREDDDL